MERSRSQISSPTLKSADNTRPIVPLLQNGCRGFGSVHPAVIRARGKSQTRNWLIIAPSRQERIFFRICVLCNHAPAVFLSKIPPLARKIMQCKKPIRI